MKGQALLSVKALRHLTNVTDPSAWSPISSVSIRNGCQCQRALVIGYVLMGLSRHDPFLPQSSSPLPPPIVAQQTRTICYGEHLSLEVTSRTGFYGGVCTHAFWESQDSRPLSPGSRYNCCFGKISFTVTHALNSATFQKNWVSTTNLPTWPNPTCLWTAATKGWRGTVYRAHATKPGTPLTGDTTRLKKDEAASVLCGTGICFPIYTSNGHKS